ncbi:amidase [Actinomadura livida]|uniref:Amidase n=1 Tax=Actinomadura livida TaxID=79909 RepID=A0A7W7MUM5_9ACTN|nr:MULTISPECIES: amidase [Actinomadura]MBB4771698.1 aspartyl-tRNA(Asn)/glutamyl-tRNA(Gln) amidotransferase subunit A [Actinomadura catellatispora]GGU01934.1 amidase [Actinomadura livida]
MGPGTGAPLSGGPLHADLERLYGIALAEASLPGALYQGDPPDDTSSPVPAGQGSAPADPVEQVERALQRIAATDGEFRAWALVDAEGARAEAERNGGRGTLRGLPVGVKDLIDVAGMPTGAGSRHLDGAGRRVPAADAGSVARLRAAGAVVVGKTTTHEYAFGGTTPPTRNPHDTARIPGGSSGGSAAAVAAGHVRLALGSDTGGSVRIPSAYCGTAGFVPSPGRLPGDGVLPLAWSLDRVGLIAATAGDIALSASALGIISPAGGAARPTGFGGLRVGVPAGTLDEPVDPAIGAAFERALATVRDLGGEVVDVEIPHGWAGVTAGMTIILGECLDYHRERRGPGGDELFGADVRAMLDLAAEVPAGAYVRAQRVRHLLRGEALAALSGVDLLAMPTMPCVAPRADAVADGMVPVGGTEVTMAAAHLRYNILANLAALPCGTQPLGTDRDGLPIGLQWVAAPGRDETLISAMTTIAPTTGARTTGQAHVR